MAEPTDKREAALAWARRGFKVFPLRPGAKLPMDKRWYDLATADLDAVQRMWTDPVLGWAKTYNIGVLTDDLIVVDIDMKNGKNGLATYLALGLPLETLTVRTPTGGFHAYFTGPPRASSAERIGGGLDTRGHHGFVIAPGSEVEAGAYVLELDLGLARAPDLLVDALEPPRLGAEYLVAVSDVDSPDAIDRARHLLEHDLPAAVEGVHGDLTTYVTALRLKDEGVSQDTALALMLEGWNDRCQPPWDAYALKEKVANAFKYGKLPPGVADPALHYEGLDLEALGPPLASSPSQVLVRPSWYYHGDPWDINVAWLYEEVLPRSGLALLVGPSRGGKTFVAMELSRSVAKGEPFFGVPASEAGGVIYLTAESLHSARLRLAAVSGDERLAIALRFVNGLSDKKFLQELINDIQAEGRHQMQAFGIVPRLLVLDTLSASGLLLDEDDNAEAAAAMAALQRVAMDLDMLVVVVHHPPKHGAGERGAGALRNSADYVLTVEREGEAAIRTLAVTKSRDGPERSLGAFTLVEKVVTHDRSGRTLKSCTLSMADAPVRESGPEVKYTALLVDSVRWGLIEHGEQIDGRHCVELDAVKEIFSERKPGRHGPKAVDSAFKGALALASETGLLESYVSAGRTYIEIKELLQ